MWTLLGCTFLYFIVFQVQGDNCPYDGELTAASTPSITIFNQSLPEPYDRIFGSRRDSLECTWIIEASDSDKIVRLNFRTFHFMNTTVSGKGDCVAVYDGDRYDTDSEHLIQELCNRAPAAVYNSTDRHLTVVFRQGDLGGRRWMTMNYTMVTSPNAVDEEAEYFANLQALALIAGVGIVVWCAVKVLPRWIGPWGMNCRRVLRSSSAARPETEPDNAASQEEESSARLAESGSEDAASLEEESSARLAESESGSEDVDTASYYSIGVDTSLVPRASGPVPSMPPMSSSSERLDGSEDVNTASDYFVSVIPQASRPVPSTPSMSSSSERLDGSRKFQAPPPSYDSLFK